jgi:hypothetical protein
MPMIGGKAFDLILLIVITVRSISFLPPMIFLVSLNRGIGVPALIRYGGNTTTAGHVREIAILLQSIAQRQLRILLENPHHPFVPLHFFLLLAGLAFLPACHLPFLNLLDFTSAEGAMVSTSH